MCVLWCVGGYTSFVRLHQLISILVSILQHSEKRTSKKLWCCHSPLRIHVGMLLFALLVGGNQNIWAHMVYAGMFNEATNHKRQ